MTKIYGAIALFGALAIGGMAAAQSGNQCYQSCNNYCAQKCSGRFPNQVDAIACALDCQDSCYWGCDFNGGN